MPNRGAQPDHQLPLVDRERPNGQNWPRESDLDLIQPTVLDAAMVPAVVSDTERIGPPSSER